MPKSPNRAIEISPRQKQILLLASEGLTDKEISAAMGLSPGTIRTYWERLRARMDATTRGEVIAKSMAEAYQQTATDLEQCRTILDAVDEFIWTALPNGEIDYVNAWFGTYSGRNPDNFLTCGCRALMPEHELPDSAERWKRAQREGSPYEARVHFLNSSGEYRAHHLRLTPLGASPEGVVKWLGRATAA